jgi:hypothetical protein
MHGKTPESNDNKLNKIASGLFTTRPIFFSTFNFGDFFSSLPVILYEELFIKKKLSV